MGKHCILILGTTALVTLAVGTTQAVAGGLALREQSAWGEGTSYAGVAAGGSLSAMFWNPATITQSGKMAIEASTSVLFPQSSQTGTATFLTPPLSALSPFGFTDQTPNSSEAAVLPSGYVAMQLTDRIWFGLSFNSPFGLSTNFENPGWAGAFYAQSSSLRTYNGAPTVAIKITDWLSVGGGVQIQYAEPHLLFATGATAPGTPTLGLLTGHGWTVGWTAGVTLTPTPWTQIGLGYRSALNQEIDGSFVAGSAGSTAITTVRWPDSASLGVRQGITSNLTLLGTVEWTGWKRIGTSVFNQSNGSPALAPNGAPGRTSVPIQRRLVLFGWSRVYLRLELDFPRWRRLRKEPDHRSGPHSAAAGQRQNLVFDRRDQQDHPQYQCRPRLFVCRREDRTAQCGSRQSVVQRGGKLRRHLARKCQHLLDRREVSSSTNLRHRSPPADKLASA